MGIFFADSSPPEYIHPKYISALKADALGVFELLQGEEADLLFGGHMNTFQISFCTLPALLALSCSGPFSNRQYIDAASGGTLQLGTQLTLSVPGGALPESGEISAAQVAVPTDAGEVRPLAAYQFGPHGTQFQVPALLTLCYSDSDLQSRGLNEDAMAIYYNSPSGLVNLGGAVNKETHCVATEVHHFSTFLVAEQPGSTVTEPAYSSLRGLPGSMDGDPIVISNNPESVSREGLLMGTEPMKPEKNVWRKLQNYPYKVNNPDDPLFPIDPGCMAGGMKSFSFYMHHLMTAQTDTAKTVNRVWVLVEPVGGKSATYKAYGAAVSESDYTGGGSIWSGGGKTPSYAAAFATLSGGLPATYKSGSVNGSEFINETKTITKTEALAVLKGNPGASVDARIRVTVTSGCVNVRVVATLPATDTLAEADTLSKKQYAWGNVPTGAGPGGAPCTNTSGTGWGRPAGVYAFDTWRNDTYDQINITGELPCQGLNQGACSTNSICTWVNEAVRDGVKVKAHCRALPGYVADPKKPHYAGGWNFLAAPPNKLEGDKCVMNPATQTPGPHSQRSPALRYYGTNTSAQTQGRDSDMLSTSNYGAVYKLKLGAKNTTKNCVRASLELSGYPGKQICSKTNSNNTRHHDAPFKVKQNGKGIPAENAVLHAYVDCNNAPTQTLAEIALKPNASVSWEIETVVPGLVSAPSGFLVKSKPGGC